MSCKPLRMSKAPNPMECEPLAQAALMVMLMPFRWKMVERFIVTVEFIDWKMAAEPTKVVSFFSKMVSCESMTALAEESLPNSTPTSFSSR